MSLASFFAREKHVMLHAQSRRFRLIKWCIILVCAALLYWWQGTFAVVAAFASLGILGTALHFFVRWKTDAWTKSWGPYKRIPLNDA